MAIQQNQTHTAGTKASRMPRLQRPHTAEHHPTAPSSPSPVRNAAQLGAPEQLKKWVTLQKK